jgi:MFS family permease
VRLRLAEPPLFTRTFVLAAAAHFLHALAFYLFLSLPGYLKELGATELDIGLLFGATAATAIVLRPPLGHAIDRRGARRVMLMGGALSTVVCAMYVTISQLGAWVYAVRIAHGISEAVLFASLFAYAAEVVPAARRIEGIALFGVSGLIPMVLSGWAGEAILAASSYTHLFAAASVLSAMAFGLTFLLPEVPRSSEIPRGILVAAADRDLLPLWFAGLFFAIAIAGPFTFIKTFVMETGRGTMGSFVAAYGLAACLVRVLLGRLPERLGPKRVLYPAMAIMVCGFAVLVAWKDARALPLSGFLCGMGHGYTFPILLGLVVDRARASERGAALSVFTALFDGGTMIGGPLLGGIVRGVGYPAMFAVAGFFAATSMVGLWVLDRQGDPVRRPNQDDVVE